MLWCLTGLIPGIKARRISADTVSMKVVISILSIVGLGLFSQLAVADIYKYRDLEGRIYFSDEPMRGNYQLIQRFGLNGKLKSKKRGRINLGATSQNKKRFSPLIDKISRETLLRPELLHAVIQAESSYDPDAVSSKGAVGLMQLMPATAKRYGVTDRRNPEQNLRGGANYLKDLLKQFDFNLRLAVAAYNAGENAVIRSGNKIPDYPETQNYVAKVMRFYKKNRSSNS